MSLAQLIKETHIGNSIVCYRPSQLYTVAVGGYVIFNIVNGAIVVNSLYGTIQAVNGAGVLVRLTANLINMDNATQDLSTAGIAGDVFISELNGGAAPIFTAGTPNFAPKTIATVSRFMVGPRAAANGDITATYTVGGTSVTMDWVLVYQKLSPYVRVWAP